MWLKRMLAMTTSRSADSHQVREPGAGTGEVPAVDGQRDAGDERCVIGREEQRGGGDLVGTTEPTQHVVVADTDRGTGPCGRCP